LVEMESKKFIWIQHFIWHISQIIDNNPRPENICIL